MFCPKCKTEFVDGIITCSDCDIQLLEQLPLPDNHQEACDINYVCVYYPINSQEVSLIKMILEREDIPYFIKNDRLHGVVLFSIAGPGQMQVHVPEGYAEQTAELLKNELGHE